MKVKSLLLVLVLTFNLFVGCEKVDTNDDIPTGLVCEVDSECVPASCCHADSCININEKPDCTGRICTMNCAPGTMDCGQGKCICENNQCTAEIGEP